jgi:hypothetical protein
MLGGTGVDLTTRHGGLPQRKTKTEEDTELEVPVVPAKCCNRVDCQRQPLRSTGQDPEVTGDPPPIEHSRVGEGANGGLEVDGGREGATMVIEIKSCRGVSLFLFVGRSLEHVYESTADTAAGGFNYTSTSRDRGPRG